MGQYRPPMYPWTVDLEGRESGFEQLPGTDTCENTLLVLQARF